MHCSNGIHEYRVLQLDFNLKSDFENGLLVEFLDIDDEQEGNSLAETPVEISHIPHCTQKAIIYNQLVPFLLHIVKYIILIPNSMIVLLARQFECKVEYRH